jgi:phytoene desaturase
MKAVVIGSGFGGLAVGLWLLSKGYHVTILESREKPGGRAYQLSLNGYTFDMGPSLITAPSLFDELFRLFGKNREDYVKFVPLDPFYRVYFQEKDKTFKKVDYNGDPTHMMGEMEALEKGSSLGYTRFFEATKPIYEAAYKKYGAQPFTTLKSFLRIFPEMLKVGAVLPIAYFAKRFFKSDFGMRTFSFHSLYIGTNPYEAPAALAFIPWLEREEGVWFADGGMYKVVEALAKLFVEQGGVLETKTRVTSLVTMGKDGGNVQKVETSNGVYESDIVVSNADVLQTYSLLDSSNAKIDKRKRSLSNASYSMSLLLLYFGLKRQYHDKLAHHTLILGEEYKKLLDEVFNKKVMPSTLSMYLHIPTVTDSRMAPDGCESMYILVPVPNLDGSFVWDSEVEQKLRNWVVDYLENTFGLDGFADAIECEKHMTPIHFRDELSSTYGAAFSTQLSLLQSVYFRQHNKADEVSNLYFVGAGTHPGPGVPGVLLTAKATASLIEKA